MSLRSDPFGDAPLILGLITWAIIGLALSAFVIYLAVIHWKLTLAWGAMTLAWVVLMLTKPYWSK